LVEGFSLLRSAIPAEAYKKIFDLWVPCRQLSAIHIYLSELSAGEDLRLVASYTVWKPKKLIQLAMYMNCISYQGVWGHLPTKS